MSLDVIDTKARVYADARDRLQAAVAELQAAMDALKRDHLPAIKRHLRRAVEHENELRALVEQAPHLFVKPRTVVLHGIQLGFEKGKGQIVFGDADTVVNLIRKKLPDLADTLIVAKYTPMKKGLAQLSAQQLKAIGCTVEGTEDRVIVRAVDSAVDKLVNALLKSLGDEKALAEAEAI